MRGSQGTFRPDNKENRHNCLYSCGSTYWFETAFRCDGDLAHNITITYFNVHHFSGGSGLSGYLVDFIIGDSSK